jgi:hypothetical protein
MMDLENASETSDNSILTRPTAREDFIAYSRRKSPESYMKFCSLMEVNIVNTPL